MGLVGDPVLMIVGDRHIDPIKHYGVLRRCVGITEQRIRERILGRNPQAEKFVPIEFDRVITGDALGVDAFARRRSSIHNKTLTVYCADDERAELFRQEGYHVVRCSDWKRQGKLAGPIRNREAMLDHYPEVCVIDGGGPGSANVLKIAAELKLNVHHFKIEGCNVCEEGEPTEPCRGGCSDGIVIRGPDGEVV